MYSVISVIVDSLPCNTKNRESTRSLTAGVRLVKSWAEASGRKRPGVLLRVRDQDVCFVLCLF